MSWHLAKVQCLHLHASCPGQRLLSLTCQIGGIHNHPSKKQQEINLQILYRPIPILPFEGSLQYLLRFHWTFEIGLLLSSHPGLSWTPQHYHCSHRSSYMFNQLLNSTLCITWHLEKCSKKMCSKKNSHYKPLIGNHLSNFLEDQGVRLQIYAWQSSAKIRSCQGLRSPGPQGTRVLLDQARNLTQTVLPHQWKASYPTQPKGRKGWSQTLLSGHFGQIRQGRRIANGTEVWWCRYTLIWIPESDSLSLWCTCFIPNVPIASDSQCAAGKIPDWQRTAHTWKHVSQVVVGQLHFLFGPEVCKNVDWISGALQGANPSSATCDSTSCYILVSQHPSSTCKVSHQRRQIHAQGSKEGERATKTLANHRIPIPHPHPVHLVHWAYDAYSCAPTRSSQDWCVARPGAPCITENK